MPKRKTQRHEAQGPGCFFADVDAGGFFADTRGVDRNRYLAIGDRSGNTFYGCINYEKNMDAYFTHSKAGYTTTEITLDWLVNIFEPKTRPENGIKDHGMLALDRHSSHVNNIKFIEHYIKMNIHLICLPAHTIHVLQPLDIGIFSPMGPCYRKELEDFLHDHGPNWAMHKGDFYPMYHKARAKVIGERNIVSA